MTPLIPITVFAEIKAELEKLKNIYPYSNDTKLLNACVEICIQTVRDIEEQKRKKYLW